jgi:hypothetical protein
VAAGVEAERRRRWSVRDQRTEGAAAFCQATREDGMEHGSRGRRRRWLGSRSPAVLLPCEREGNKEGWALCLLMTTFCSWSGKQDWAAVVI